MAFMPDEDEKTQSQTGGLPIAIGPLKLKLEIENIERLRATWQKYCVPISKQFWPLLRNEIDIGLQKQLLRKLKNVADLDEKAREILTARHAAAEEISPSISGPLLEAAAEEERDELKEVWAKLLAAAMDPTRKNRVRLSFITILKQMDPMDARVLDSVHRNPAGFGEGINGRDALSKEFGVTQDEILVSFENLERLRCVGFADPAAGPKISPIITPSGRLLMEALR
jgi:Abortive infection alpha